MQVFILNKDEYWRKEPLTPLKYREEEDQEREAVALIRLPLCILSLGEDPHASWHLLLVATQEEGGTEITNPKFRSLRDACI